jgi:hypothetical protein
MAIVGGGKTRIQAIYDDGSAADIKATAEGHLEMAIHAPRLPFGSVDVASLDPIIQQDAVYGLPEAEILKTESGGTVAAADNLFVMATNGGTIGNTAALQSRKRLRYRPGQGVVARYTALFTQGIANNIQVAGIGTGESGYYFGYNGTSFGILSNTGGVREIQTLSLSAGAGGTETLTMRLNGVEYVFQVTVGTALSVAWQITQQTFAGWKTEQRGTTVVFLADAVGNRTGSFTLTSSGTAAGTFAETKAGVAVTDTWIPQSTWNGDKMDGAGPSGVTLDPTKGNVYQIDVQYLGFGTVSFKVEASQEGNNPDWVVVHTINSPNTRTAVNITQPSFPLTFANYNIGTASGGTTLKTASYAGFISGIRRLTGPRHTFFNTVTSSTSAYVPLFTIMNSLVYGDRANQSVSYLLSTSGAAKSNAGITTFYVIKNGVLVGTPAFGKHADSSVMLIDKSATGVTFDNEDVAWSATVSETGQFIYGFDDQIDIQPGETLTLAVRSVTQTAVCVGQINVREDQ